MTTAQQTYSRLEGLRYSYLDRGRTSSKLTLPYVLPEESFGPHSRLNTPFQSVGARGVNNLASKLLLALLPPNAPFFRLQADTAELAKSGTPEEVLSEIENSLQRVEDLVMAEIAKEAYRVALHEALKHLIIAGNALLYMPEEGGLRVFNLNRFVIERDPMGNVLTIATKETISRKALDPEIHELLETHGASEDESMEGDVNLYTSVRRDDNMWKITQDINGIVLPKSGGELPIDRCPYIPLRFSRIDGESYGRGYVEEYLGDVQSLEALTQAIVEGSAAAAKVLFLVSPNGTTRARTLADSPNGAIVQGNAADVTTLQVNKFNDFKVAQMTMDGIKDRLGAAFLLTSGVVRSAERVTAEEIRMLSQELESSLGGLYSLLSNELQLPLIERLMFVMSKAKKLPKLPKNLVQPVIVTGVEALGRGNDLNKLDQFLAGAAQVVGPQAVAQFVNVQEYFKRRATALGIKTIGLIKTEEQLAQESQQQMASQMSEKLGPAGIKALSDQYKQANSPEQQQLDAAQAEQQ